MVIGDFKDDHTGGIVTRRWGIARRPSTLRPAPTPTTRWRATSTESGSNNPDSDTGWSRHRGPVIRNHGVKDVFFLVCDGLKGLPVAHATDLVFSWSG